ncbi:MAG: hydroxymethylglutaryl-CoA lyase [Solirubrobacteraceae bacterium]|nr:hydroxymethylglutaryl-CoA lyase [Solirubrobacteraceae bacterium]
MIEIVEVGPRDGLQNAPRTFAPALRAELCMRAAASGIRRVEAVSFVHPDRVPQMAGAEAVVCGIDIETPILPIGLVLNERGLDRLLDIGMHEARIVVAASDAFSRRNVGTSTEDALTSALRMISRVRELGVRAGGVIATAFGCPFSGDVPLRDTLAVAEKLAEAGADELVFADTIGVAAPREIRDVLMGARPLGLPVGLHLHNTRNTGYANAVAAVEGGATSLDAAIGGLGGCPFAPGATGNVATEDLVYLLEREGITTGVNLDSLVETAQWLHEQTGLTLPGQVHAVPRFTGSPAAGRSSDPAVAGQAPCP